MITKPQKEYLLPKAYNAAIRAGAAILEVYADPHIDVSLKSDMTPITLADRKAHSIIKEYLSQTRIPLLSEEGREMMYTERKDWDLFWLVDPLDGTVEFIKGNGEFTVNIALISDNRPILGVIYVPLKKLIYFSDNEAGSFRMSDTEADPNAEYDYASILGGKIEKLPLSSRRNEPLKIAISRSHSNSETARHINELLERYEDAQIIEHGSSYKLCMLAEGSADYYPRMTETYEWDTAAGEAILDMAGGSLYRIPDGQRLQYNKESLGNPNFACCSKWFNP